MISKPTLENFLRECGVDTGTGIAYLPDEFYALPDLQWMIRTGAAAIVVRCRRDVGIYQKDSADCDDFAHCAAEEIRRIHRQTKVKPKNCGVAFCVWPYRRWDGRGHVINAFVPRVSGVLQLKFIEPQTGRMVQLTQKEITSCVNPQF